jgi:homoserine O-succinyltransferase
MPLIIEGGRVPPRWAEKQNSTPAKSSGYDGRPESVRIALINNMPDAALEDTEIQFFELLDDASGELPVLLTLYSLNGVPRGERGQQHVNSFYSGTNDLLNGRFDGAIVTGTEPRQPNLRDEPYWSALTDVLDWAEGNTASAVLSCLAAHAGVLHSDGIERHPLADKQFGVFDFNRVGRHELTDDAANRVCFPHSRWNEVRADELTASGYQVLTQSTEGGVDSFVKKKKRSLFVHFQGHPEYGAQTLLREYRRDVKRFLRHEREAYPSMPKGYFDTRATRFLTDFRDVVLSDRREELMEDFPEKAVAGGLQKVWHASANGFYRNWLRYVLLNKAGVPVFSAMPFVRNNVQRRRSALR